MQGQWLPRLTDNNRNWGFGLCFLFLRNVRGFLWIHKRVYRSWQCSPLVVSDSKNAAALG